MKKTTGYLLFVAVVLFNLFYLALTADSFYWEYVKDTFVYWGYPQWGWMYSDPKVYFWFNLLYLAFLLVMFVAAIGLAWKKKLKAGFVVLLIPLLTAGAFLYMPTYNWNRQFAIFNAERTTENSRIPAGKWWASLDQMQRYYDVSGWERLKGYFGRGEWPGGYAMWGDYRIWLLPDFATDTLGRRGMVLHGGTKNSSPWGIDMGDDIIDFAIQLRQNDGPMNIDVRYDGHGQSRTAAAKEDAENPKSSEKTTEK